MMRALCFFVLCLAVVLACQFSPPVQGGSEAGVVLALPPRIGMLVGRPDEPSQVERDNLPTDTEFAKMTYMTATDRDNERDIAHFSIVLAGSERRSIHRPEVCLKGQGWSVTGQRIREVDLGRLGNLRVTDLAIERVGGGVEGRPMKGRYVYWFIGTDTTTPSHAERIWRTTLDSVVNNVNHRWAYAAVSTLVTEGHDPSYTRERQRTDEQTERLIDYIISHTAPHFQKSLHKDGGLLTSRKDS